MLNKLILTSLLLAVLAPAQAFHWSTTEQEHQVLNESGAAAQGCSDPLDPSCWCSAQTTENTQQGTVSCTHPSDYARMFNPTNWPQMLNPAIYGQFMKPQFFMHFTEPQTIAAWMNPASYFVYMNPATYMPLINPANYTEMMNPATYMQMMNPANYAVFMNPATYLQWFNPASYMLPASATETPVEEDAEQDSHG